MYMLITELYFNGMVTFISALICFINTGSKDPVNGGQIPQFPDSFAWYQKCGGF